MRTPHLETARTIRVCHAQRPIRRHNAAAVSVTPAKQRNRIANTRFNIVKVSPARETQVLAVRLHREVARIDMRLTTMWTGQILELPPEQSRHVKCRR